MTNPCSVCPLTDRPSGVTDVDFALPDSITTWVLQAVGVSPEAGLCVAPPINVTAFRPFFVHVELPYSAVRLEQLEVRATVYNYMHRTLSVSGLEPVLLWRRQYIRGSALAVSVH